MGMTERPDTGFAASATSPSETFNRSLSLWNSLTIGFATMSPRIERSSGARVSRQATLWRSTGRSRCTLCAG